MGQNPGFFFLLSNSCFNLVFPSTGQTCVGGRLPLGFGRHRDDLISPFAFPFRGPCALNLESCHRIDLFMDLHLLFLVFSVTFYSSDLRYFLCFTKPVIVFPVDFCLVGLVFWTVSQYMAQAGLNASGLGSPVVGTLQVCRLVQLTVFSRFLKCLPTNPWSVDFIPFIIT